MEHVKIAPADFAAAMRLKSAVLKAAADAGINIEKLAEMDISDAVGAAINIDVSKDVYDAIWPCLIKCTYKGAKITQETFDAPDMWELYYPVVIECIKVNLSPFFKGLLSAFSGSSAIMNAITRK